MASDRRQFERAYSRWEELRRAEAFSTSDTDGIVAVACSDYPFYYKRDGRDAIADDIRDIEEFENEAQVICEQLSQRGIVSELFIGATAADMRNILNDTSISSVVVIGHGSLSDVYLEGAHGGRYDWRDAARDATHLKLGRFTQRQCGILKRQLNVPLGFFVVSGQHNVCAAVGQVFNPEELGDSHRITSVITDSAPTSYRDAVRLFNPVY